MNLYTIIVSFSDHLSGVEQVEAVSPEEAAQMFVRTAECLDGYDRELLGKNINPLLHIAGPKGVWLLSFGVDYFTMKWPNDNPLLGGTIIQADKNGPTREPNLK